MNVSLFSQMSMHWQRQQRLEDRGKSYSVAKLGHDHKSCAIWRHDPCMGQRRRLANRQHDSSHERTCAKAKDRHLHGVRKSRGHPSTFAASTRVFGAVTSSAQANKSIRCLTMALDCGGAASELTKLKLKHLSLH